MRITYNELVVYAGRAFNSLHKKRGEADIIAGAAADLEAIKKNGLRHFVQFLKRVSCNAVDKPEITIKSDQEIFVDLKNSCIICYFPNLINYALEHKAGDTISLQIMNEFDNWLALGRLLRHHVGDLNIYCVWKDDRDESTVQYLYDAKNKESSIYEVSYPNNIALETHMFSITFSEHSLSYKLLKDYKNIEIVSNEEIASLREQSLEQGLFVYEDDWQYVKELASKILVAESDQSQKQAGE